MSVLGGNGQSIHQSIARVEFSRNMLLLNFFEVISGQKKF
jgi:hypothetical protein